VNGRRQYISCGSDYGKAKAEAAAVKAHQTQERATGRNELVQEWFAKKSETRLAAALDKYIGTRLAAGCKPLTVRFYTQMVPRFPADLLERLVDDIDQDIIATFVDGLIANGQSPKTIRSILTFASSACKFCKQVKGMNDKNPFEDFNKPRIDPHEPKPFTATELKRIFKHLDEKLVTAFWLMASTGIRSGEVAALRFEDINFKTGWMTISKSRWKDQESTTKTLKSNRRVLLDTKTKGILKALKTKREASDTDYVIVNQDGLPYNTYWQKPWRQALTAAGIKPYRRPYVLRSSFASIALQNGAQLGCIRDVLGHSSIKIRADKYLRYLDETAKENRSKVSAALQGVL
jgi:integrase